MSKVVIFGEGKYAEEAYFYFKNDSTHDVIAFTADEKYITRKELFGLPVIPFEEVIRKYPPADFKMFIALGYQNLNKLRAEKYFEAKNKGYQLVSYISSLAGNFGNVEVGENCFVMENSALQPCSKIGNNVTIWSNNLIGHHSTIEDHCYIAGQVVVAGNTTVGQYCFLGVGAIIGHEITIGRECIVGAGSIITKNAEPNSVYIAQDTLKYRLDSKSFLKLTNL
jgi:sugar O-acyltransferase (sialic acid O-acetyltransferase NeuD family)